MYARVAVASNALDLGDLQLPVANLVHSALIERLLAHGRLVFSNPQEAHEFVKAIQGAPGVPQDARTKWSSLLKHLRDTRRIVFVEPPGTTSLSEVDAIGVLRAGWSRQTDVAVVASANCASLGVPEATGVLSDPSAAPDVAVAAAAPMAPALSRVLDLEQHPVLAHGSPREEFWTSVLEPMATGAVSATVLDGYLFGVLSSIAHGRTRSPRGGEHVTWLLERLDGVMAGGATVRLIANAANVEPGDTAASIAQEIHQQWGPLKVGRLAQVEVLLGQSQPGRRFPHDRHIRFSTGSAVKVDAGLDRLRQERIWDTNGMWWSYHWQPAALEDLRAQEDTAKSLARHPQALALNR